MENGLRSIKKNVHVEIINVLVSDFTIIRDTREKQGWFFTGEQVEFKGLTTGDYSLKGFEDKICIERKKSVGELASNVTQARFEREMERMAEIPHAFIFLEFSMYDLDIYPAGTNLPRKVKRKIKVRGKFIKSILRRYLLDYNIQTILCGDALQAEAMALSLLKDFYDKLQ